MNIHHVRDPVKIFFQFYLNFVIANKFSSKDFSPHALIHYKLITFIISLNYVKELFFRVISVIRLWWLKRNENNIVRQKSELHFVLNLSSARVTIIHLTWAAVSPTKCRLKKEKLFSYIRRWIITSVIYRLLFTKIASMGSNLFVRLFSILFEILQTQLVTKKWLENFKILQKENPFQ